MGHLSLDWLAQTIDPFPLFSSLVSVTIYYLGENAFYLYQILIQGIYIYSILEIGSYVFKFGNLGIKYLSYWAILLGLYSGLFYRFLLKLPALSPLAFVVNPNGMLTSGVAGQYILGSFFQPSTFGVLIIFSIYNYLYQRNLVAIICLVITTVFHSSYLITIVVLTFTYMTVIIVKDRNYLKSLILGGISVVLISPVLIYNYRHFKPTNTEIYTQAQHILINYRMPHHALVENWFNEIAVFQFIIVTLAIYFIKNTKLFPVLLGPFLAAIVLTGLQIFTGSQILAILFPWRMSVFLVPIASTVIIGYSVSYIFETFHSYQHRKLPVAQRQLPGSLAVFLMFIKIIKKIICGFQKTIMIPTFQCVCLVTTIFLLFSSVKALFNAPKVGGGTASILFITHTYQPGHLYLIPPSLEWFRLAARIPIFVDFKSHPYKDSEIIEWFHRLEISKNFYLSNGTKQCEILKSASHKYGISHVLSESFITDCEILRKSYSDADFIIYEILKTE